VRFFDASAITHGNDPAVLDSHCFGCWLRIVDGDDIAAQIDGIGRIDLFGINAIAWMFPHGHAIRDEQTVRIPCRFRSGAT
jgi:hypothetical protein